MITMERAHGGQYHPIVACDLSSPRRMTDTKKIEPALTAERWEFVRRVGPLHVIADSVVGPHGQYESIDPKDLPDIMACANAALPDTDLRKITRAHVAELLYAANEFRVKALLHQAEPEKRNEVTETAASLEGLAAALESYLPPE